MTTAAKLSNSVNKMHLGAAAVALTAAATITPVVAPIVSQAAPPSVASSAPVLTWGFDALDPGLLARMNDNGPRAAVVGESPTPAQLLQMMIQGIATGISDIARGAVVVVGTAAYVAIAFTGGIITTIGNFLPGPIGDFVSNLGTAVNNVANVIAEALRVGPYATSSV